MKVLAEDWFMDFTGCRVSPEMLRGMVIMARRRCKFFPTTPEMLEFYREMAEHKRRNAAMVPSLPEPEPTDEDIRINSAIIEKAKEIIAKGLNGDDAEAEMEKFIATVKAGEV